ncbi:hypothetical protein HDU93_008184 [Gonapodya sp. JEL0774]|nr:hypothetical protein HDU93_008184 [Gonapodya sp. JEL0774]
MDDDELRLAIELSLQDSKRSDPDDDDDLKRAIELSIADHGTQASSSSSPGTRDSSDLNPDALFSSAAKLTTTSSFLINRAMLEQERIARTRKRALEETDECESHSKRLKPSVTGATARFWEATICNSCDLGLDLLIDSKRLRKGLFSSFDWGHGFKGVDWIADKLEMETEAYFVVHEPNKPRIVGASPRRIFLYPPVPENFGTMHVKLMLLVFQDCLRVVITSANLTHRDWSTVDNVVFAQDFPPRDPSTNYEALPSFGTYLHKYLKVLTVHKFVDVVREYDFTSAKAELVGSIPSHSHGIEFSGVGRLAAVAKKIGFSPKAGYSVEYQTSSLGALKIPWLHLFHSACSGTLPTATSRSPLPPLFRVLFPTLSTISSAKRNGSYPEGCEAICLERKWYNAESFPKTVMRDSVSTRSGAVSHAKVVVVEQEVRKVAPQEKASGTSQESSRVAAKGRVRGFVYYGSHNCSQSAWGTVVKSKASGQREVRVNNYELGVVVPLYDDEEPPYIPYKRPASEYKGNEPWFRSEHLG